MSSSSKKSSKIREAAKDKKVQKNEKKKKYDRTSSIVAIVIVLLVILGGYLFVSGINQDSNDELPEEYNGFKFFRDSNGYWMTTLNSINGDKDFPFHFHPKQLETNRYDMRINQRLAEVQSNKGIVVVAFSPEMANPDLDGKGNPAIAGFEIQKITSGVLGMRTQGALTGTISGANITVANCSSNSGPKVFVIEFRMGDSKRIFSENYCAIIQVSHLNQTVELADLLVFKLIGILPPESV